jgi:NADP-dependent 3-hydroxy acid dehydrogenase YdfG
VVRSRPLAAPGLAAPGLFGDGLLAIVPDDHGVAEAVHERLLALGLRAEVRPDVPRDARAVLYLGALRCLQTVDEALSINREAFAIAVGFAQGPQKEGGLFVTVQDTGGDLGISGRSGARAWLGGLSGLAKTAAHEWPHGCARAIDIEQGGRESDAVAGAIVQELLEGGAAPEVGLSASGQRVTLQNVTAEAATTRALPPRPLIVATGGARGVTAECLLALTKETKPRLLLLGRTTVDDEPEYLRGIEGDAALKRAVLAAQPRPDSLTPRALARIVAQVTAAREIRRNLARFAALGAEARYESIDVRDAAAMSALLRDVRSVWGPIHVLVHGAGVLSDGLLEQRTDATAFDAVFDTKVRGLAALLAATEQDPIDWLCLFSSVAARDGNAGQADYAMANEILNKVAAVESVSRRAGRATALGWGPWAGGMVTPALAQHFTTRGVGLIPLAAGAAAFVKESQVHGETEVLLGAADMAQPRRALRAQLLVTAQTFPHLEDHRVQGSVVLPLVSSIDAFARLCVRDRVGKNGAPLVLGDLRVLRGIVMADFAGTPNVLTLAWQPDDRLELRDAAGALRISARLLIGETPSLLDMSVREESHVALAGPLYGPGRLFHGPKFQLIQSVKTLSAQAAVASVAGVLGAGWPLTSSPCDPAMLDAGLQLALLSGLCGDDSMGQTLPLAIERVVLYQPPANGPLVCHLRTRSRTRSRARYDILFTDARQQPLAQLQGVEMYAVPSGSAEASRP